MTLRWMLVGALGLGVDCVRTDQVGCPLDLRDAVGRSCAEADLRCGEVSQCAPCGAPQPEACFLVVCVNGEWTEADPPCDG